MLRPGVWRLWIGNGRRGGARYEPPVGLRRDSGPGSSRVSHLGVQPRGEPVSGESAGWAGESRDPPIAGLERAADGFVPAIDDPGLASGTDGTGKRNRHRIG